MAVTRPGLEALAPDQATLEAARDLARGPRWHGLAGSRDARLIWGECQGSGANPYRVMADCEDLGSKCTCPSRKFPCKHALALLLLTLERPSPFAAAETPEWVTEWLQRRRTPGERPKGQAARSKAPQAGAEATTTPAAAVETARRRQRAERREAATRQGLLASLKEFEGWIADQLRLGLAGLLQELPLRCRTIAARLVDGKAAALAGALDELPGRLLQLASDERPQALVSELARLLLLTRAFRATPDDPELRRLLVGAPARDELLADPSAPRVTGRWEIVGSRALAQRNGLLSRETWLLNLEAAGPRFALLLDFAPARGGKKDAIAQDRRFFGTLAYYPARRPVRAVIVERQADAAADSWSWPEAATGDPLAEYRAALRAAPWTAELPLLLPAGRLAYGVDGTEWWQGLAGDGALPLAGSPAKLMRGALLAASAAVWNGTRLWLLSAATSWGRLDAAA